VEASLRHVAKETGGRALLNSTRGEAFEQVEGDTRSYYWLGFTPTWKGNDQRHDVRVEVVRPGLEVRNRDSFLDLSRKAEVSMMVESAMLFGNPPGAVSMPMQLGKPVPSGKKLMTVPITLAIPVESITLVPVEGRYASELELRVAAVDEDGNRSDVPVIPLTVASEKQPEPGGYVKYETKLTLRRKGHHLTVAIFDPLSGKITTAEADVEAPKR
jgi:hypothetical protein